MCMLPDARRAAHGPRHVSRSALLLACLLAVAGGAARAQEPSYGATGARLELSSASAAARTAVAASLVDFDFFFASRAQERLRVALALDSAWGYARALHASFTPGLTAAQRRQESQRALADAARGGSASEVLVALAIREQAAGRGESEIAAWRAAAQVLPGDPHVAFQHALAVWRIRGNDAGTAALRSVTAAFPRYGAPYNHLAYLATGMLSRPPSDEAIALADTQLRLAPDQPNAHDTYADLLKRRGRFAEAVEHYRHSLEMAPNDWLFYQGPAELAQLQGDGAAARMSLENGLRLGARVLGDSIALMAQIGGSYAHDGDFAAAARQIAEVSRLAERGADTATVLVMNRRLMLLAGARGDAREVATQLAAAKMRNAVDSIFTLRVAAMSFAFAGRTDSAAARLAAFRAVAQAAADTGAIKSATFVNGLILAARGDCRGVEAEFAQVDSTAPLVLATRAQCLSRAKKKDQAAALRMQLLGRGDVSLHDIQQAIARVRVRKL